MVKDYQRGKIYKIVCNITDEIYIGSTCEPTLARRLAKHVSCFKSWKNQQYGNMSSFKIIERDDYYIELLEVFPCNIKEEILLRERYHIKDNICINKNKNPIATIEEKKEQSKEYREINKDRLKEIHKDYYMKNKEKHNQQAKVYYENNKNHLKEKMKEWIDKNKDTEHFKEIKKLNKLKQKELHGTITCSCGVIIPNFTYDIKRHEKTLKHLNNINMTC